MPRCPNPRCQLDNPAGSTQCANPACQCLLPEAVVAGRYRIETLIGLGGMGAVYRVSDTFEMEQVALKVLSLTTHQIDVQIAVERFRREARYAHQLHHRNIVSVLNFGQDGNLLYLVMPLITGGTLKALLKGEKPLPTQQARQYLHDLADAIDAVHAHPQQIVHRDIKPSNLLIHQDDGRLVLTDFGIARAMQREKALTQRGWSLGTEHYIAPEQEQGKPKPSSDIYAMGVVAYQMFTGLLPFQAVVKSHGQIMSLPPPSTLNEWLPLAIDAVIFRAIETDPSKRYPTGRAFADAVDKALSSDTSLNASEPTIPDTITTASKANAIVRTLIPENPCTNCGRENRSSSRFCRYCGHSLDETSPLVTEVYQVGYSSDIGKNVQANEDMLLIVQGLCITLQPPPRPFGLFAVADGLRGPQDKSAGGYEASRLAVETVADVLIPLLTMASSNTSRMSPDPGNSQVSSTRSTAAKLPRDEILAQWIRDAMHQANQVIYHCNADYDSTMASTLTIALMYKRHLYVASVGDSRAYCFRADKKLHCITNEPMVVAKSIGAVHSDNNTALYTHEPFEHAKRKQPNRYLGTAYQIQIELFQQEVEAGDLVLLCTDGLWHMVHDDEIEELLAYDSDPQMLASILVDKANDADGEGNASALVIRVL